MTDEATEGIQPVAMPQEQPQDLLSQLGRLADAHPGLLYGAAVVLLAPLLLVILGLPASTAIGLWFVGLLVLAGVKLYWVSGHSFREDWPKLMEAWQRHSAASTAPGSWSGAAGMDVGPAAAGLPQDPVLTDTTSMLIRCPDCAEDIEAGSVACNFCGHRLDPARMAVCGTCRCRVEASLRGTCPACHSAVGT